MPRPGDDQVLSRLRPLNHAASTPLWRQLKHVLRDLATFDLRPGDRIPSEAELCRHYGLSRVTVRQAITSLVDSGYLARQHGRGTYVLPRRSAEPLADSEHFLASAFDTPPRGALRLFSAELVPADQWVADRLCIQPGEDVQKVRKVLLHGGQPVAYRVTWVPAGRCPGLLDRDLLQPLPHLYEQVYGLVPARADEAIEFVYADEFRSQVLEVPDRHPLMVVERLVYGESGTPIEFSRAYYRADRFQLQRQLTRARPQWAEITVLAGGSGRLTTARRSVS